MIPRLSIVIAVYREPVEHLKSCIQPLLNDDGVETLVLNQLGRVDVRRELGAMKCSERSTLAVKDIPDRSIAYARNHGLEVALAPVVAFLDPDVIPMPGWAEAIVACFSQPQPPAVMAGRIMPLYESKPSILNQATLVREAQSILNLGDLPMATSRGIAGNLAVSKEGVGGLRFPENLGRIGGTLLGGEETAFCEAVARQGGRILYWPAASVRHRIPRSRTRLRWLIRRFYYGGLSRGLRGGPPNPLGKKRTWQDWIAVALLGPAYGFGLVRGIARRR